MNFDTTDSKDAPQDTDVGKETADPPEHCLDPIGQRAMQVWSRCLFIASNVNNDVGELP